MTLSVAAKREEIELGLSGQAKEETLCVRQKRQQDATGTTTEGERK